MKKKFFSFTLLLSITLFGRNHTAVEDTKETEKKPIVKSERIEQKVIIMDSIDEPLPPEAKNVQSMDSDGGPQQIPNVNLNDPIVITKMPYSEKEKP